MGIDIDLYQFQATVVDKPDDEITDWLLAQPEKVAHLVKVGEDCPEEVREGLARLGVKPGDSVVLIAQ